MTEIKGCPFCGSLETSTSEGRDSANNVLHYVECEDCSAMSLMSEDINLAVKHWNRRTAMKPEVSDFNPEYVKQLQAELFALRATKPVSSEEEEFRNPIPDGVDLAIAAAALAVQDATHGDYGLRVAKLAVSAYQAIRDKKPVSGWQPIETAPKDGTVLLLHWDWEPMTVVGYFGDLLSSARKTGKNIWRVKWDEESTHDDPTHWMPLPSLPKQEP